MFEAWPAGRLWRSVFLLLFRKEKAEVCALLQKEKKKKGKDNKDYHRFLICLPTFFSKASGMSDTCPASCSRLHQGMCRRVPPLSDL